MTTTDSFMTRLKRALAAFSGSEPPAPPPTVPPPAAPVEEETDTALLRSRIRSLEMDVEERERRIDGIRKEFELLRKQAEADQAGAGAAELEALAKRLAPLLSQVPTMRSLHEEGKEIRVDDLFKLLEKFVKTFHDAGMEPLGEVGAHDRFDPARHQRMSGGDVSDGDPVKVRFIGYRFGDKVLVKAMVSREE